VRIAPASGRQGRQSSEAYQISRWGFKRVNIRGSHHVYKKGEKILTVVKPHGGHKHCHWLDVKDTIRVLEED